MGSHVGDWFNAQKVFNADDFACSAGQTISEYCAKAQDTCCAICPNAPITGPGTLIVMTLGTFVNLLFVLWYQSEAPYNLAYQIVAVDGMLFGLLNRLVQSEYRLSQFHYAMVPLAMMSCMPIALAACLNDYLSYHATVPSAAAALFAQLHNAQQEEEEEEPNSDPDHPHTPSSSSRSRSRSRSSTLSISNALGRSGSHSRGKVRPEPIKKTEKKVPEQTKDIRPPGHRDLIDKTPLPRRYLIITAWTIFAVHLPIWIATFVYLYGFNSKFNQPQCADEFPLQEFENRLTGLVASWLFFAVLVCAGFGYTIFRDTTTGGKKDFLELIGAFLHLTSRPGQESRRGRFWDAFDSRSSKKYPLFLRKGSRIENPILKARARGRSMARWGISLGVFGVWVVEYMWIYFSAIDRFVLIGNNGFDYGQVVAVTSIGVPLFLIVRAQLDYQGYHQDKWGTWHQNTEKYLEEQRRKAEERARKEEIARERRERRQGKGRAQSPAGSSFGGSHSAHSSAEEARWMSGALVEEPGTASRHASIRRADSTRFDSVVS